MSLVVELAAWVARRRTRYRVSGTSMAPAFGDQEMVLVKPTSSIRVGDIVVSRHPWKQVEIVKQVAVIDGDLLTLWSPSGHHSEHFGRVNKRHVRGRVTTNLSQRHVITKP